MKKERCIKLKSIFFLTGLVFGIFLLPSGVEGYCNVYCGFYPGCITGVRDCCCVTADPFSMYITSVKTGVINGWEWECQEWDGAYHVDYCSHVAPSGTRYTCKKNGIPSGSNGELCGALDGRFVFGDGCVFDCNKWGTYDEYEQKCVECSGKIENRILGDSDDIYAPCDNNYGILGDGQCESACGADSYVDEIMPGSCSATECGYGNTRRRDCADFSCNPSDGACESTCLADPDCDGKSPGQSCTGGTCNDNCVCIATTTTTTTTTTTIPGTTTTTTPATTTTTTPATTTTTVPECIVNSDCCYLAEPSKGEYCVRCNDGECRGPWSCLSSGGCYPTEADCGCPPPTTTTTITTTTTTTTIPSGSPINPPSVETVGHENLAPTSVTLKGRLTNSGGANICLVWFEYGISGPPYASSTSYQTIINCNSVSFPYVFSADISYLSTGTTYYFEAKAKNGGSW